MSLIICSSPKETFWLIFVVSLQSSRHQESVCGVSRNRKGAGRKKLAIGPHLAFGIHTSTDWDSAVCLSSSHLALEPPAKKRARKNCRKQPQPQAIGKERQPTSADLVKAIETRSAIGIYEILFPSVHCIAASQRAELWPQMKVEICDFPGASLGGVFDCTVWICFVDVRS